MILNGDKKNNVSTNLGSSSQFAIQASKKAFEILSGGIYTDTKRAIVREVSCNAFDAHAMVGKQDTPFEVHLPNRLEPWFSVTDFGCGMSEEEISEIYTTYFSSTKTDSNDVIGALGLGSKSPFSYTDSFTLESAKDGIKNTFICYISENGVPSLTKTSTVETDETGTTVKVPIKAADFVAFKVAAEETFWSFKVKPTTNIPLSYKKVSHYGEHFLMIENRTWGPRFAVQGNVAYKVDGSRANSKLPTTVVPIYKIGQLSFATSREELQYDDMTTENLKSDEKFKLIAQELKEMVKDRVEKADSLQAAVKEYNALADLLTIDIVDEFGLEYKDYKLSKRTLYPKIPRRYRNMKAKVANKRYARGFTQSSVDGFTLDKYHLFYADIKTYAGRVNHYLKESTDVWPGDVVFVIPTDNQKILDLISQGYIDIKPVSSLERPPKKEKAPKKERRKVEHAVRDRDYPGFPYGATGTSIVKAVKEDDDIIYYIPTTKSIHTAKTWIENLDSYYNQAKKTKAEFVVRGMTSDTSVDTIVFLYRTSPLKRLMKEYPDNFVDVTEEIKKYEDYQFDSFYYMAGKNLHVYSTLKNSVISETDHPIVKMLMERKGLETEFKHSVKSGAYSARKSYSESMADYLLSKLYRDYPIAEIYDKTKRHTSNLSQDAQDHLTNLVEKDLNI